MSEKEALRRFSTLHPTLQRAASRLAEDMAEITGDDDTNLILAALDGLTDHEKGR